MKLQLSKTPLVLRDLAVVLALVAPGCSEASSPTEEVAAQGGEGVAGDGAGGNLGGGSGASGGGGKTAGAGGGGQTPPAGGAGQTPPAGGAGQTPAGAGGSTAAGSSGAAGESPVLPAPTPPTTEAPAAGGAPSMDPAAAGGMSAAGGQAMLPQGGSAGMPGEVMEPEGNAGAGGMPASNGGAGGMMPEDVIADLPPFSFFVTSYAAITRLSGSPDGFGGDLRYGEQDGLSGADKMCTEVAEASMPGSGAKQWRAFLSVVMGPDGNQVDAIDRIGEGPWYDRLGRLVGQTREDLIAGDRPRGADPEIIDDLPNEDGVGNHLTGPNGEPVDNHHILTGSGPDGRLYGPMATCADWTSTEKSADGRPRIGFSWPARNRVHWISGQDEGGCLVGVDLDGGGGSNPNVGTVGSGGGYGGIYCFALSP